MKILSRVYTTLVFIFLYAPIFLMILFSFNSSNSTGVFEGFSFKWYRELINGGTALAALMNTLILAVCASLISTVIGTMAAVGISKFRNKTVKNLTMGATNIPMMNPDIVTGISMMLLFVFVGRAMGLASKLNFYTLLISHVTFCLPYVILNVLPRINQMDKYLPEAALDLGCTPLQSFFKVELPCIMPGVVSGAIMAFTLSLDDFVISHFTGEGFQTLPLYIYSMTKKRVTPDMYALSTIIFVAILLLLLLSNFSQARAEKREQKKR